MWSINHVHQIVLSSFMFALFLSENVSNCVILKNIEEKRPDFCKKQFPDFSQTIFKFQVIQVFHTLCEPWSKVKRNIHLADETQDLNTTNEDDPTVDEEVTEKTLEHPGHNTAYSLISWPPWKSTLGIGWVYWSLCPIWGGGLRWL